MLKVTEVLGLDQTLRQRGHGGTHAAEGPGKHRKTLPQVGKGGRRPVRLLGAGAWHGLPACVPVLFRADVTRLERELRAGRLSTGGPGGRGGTARPAETRSSLGCSATGTTPGRCLGSSGENRSAGRKPAGRLLGQGGGVGPLTTGRSQAVSTGGSGSEPPWLTAN